ncbi:hypothetical protein GCM10020221_21910 [Streptomyces thioluteus]|uniref:Acyltransferase 3 domain-containing protein n=1 Tax=Streptomyces thioluteus TaxID=66431 RepID=A0ABP6J8T5_STRTU
MRPRGAKPNPSCPSRHPPDTRRTEVPGPTWLPGTRPGAGPAPYLPSSTRTSARPPGRKPHVRTTHPGPRPRRGDPAGPRPRALDALRAVAILGVVLGHWLVTALVAGDGALGGASPLQHMPWLTPVSWLFQTLALFFFVGGVCGTRSHAAARARGTAYRTWLGGRLARLGRPVLALLAVWAAACGIALACGGSEVHDARANTVASGPGRTA